MHILLPNGLSIFEVEALAASPGTYLSREVFLSHPVKELVWQFTLTGPSSPVGEITFEGRVSDDAAWVDLGVDATALADIDAATDDSVLVAMSTYVPRVRLRVEVDSGTAALTAVVVGRT